MIHSRNKYDGNFKISANNFNAKFIFLFQLNGEWSWDVFSVMYVYVYIQYVDYYFYYILEDLNTVS